MESSSATIRSINENFIFFYMMFSFLCSFTVFLFFIQFLSKQDLMVNLYFSFYMIQGITSFIIMLSYVYSYIVKIILFDFTMNIILFICKIIIEKDNEIDNKVEVMMNTLCIMLYIKCVKSVIMIYILIKLKTNHSEKCPICLEEIYIDVYKTECNHLFHNKCIYNWVVSKIKIDSPEDNERDRNRCVETEVDCPMCRTKMSVKLNGV